MKIIIIILSILFTLSGCAPNKSGYVKDGKEYGVTAGLFRERWWNYYERGLSFVEGEFLDEAVKDFKTAIEKREKDQWRSRTYGMHFVDYFPHRELGIIYFSQKKYQDAVQELEGSLGSAESSKAKYFLNKARKAILEQTKADILPPALKISSPYDGFLTNAFSIVLRGDIEDDHFVSSVSLNEIPHPLELSAKKVPLEKELDLKEGLNEIKVKASDLTGKTSEKTLKIEVDRKGPVIIIEEQQISGRKVLLSGFISDDTGISSISLNGHDLAAGHKPGMTVLENAKLEIEIHEEINLPEGDEPIIIKAEDLAENVTTGEVHVTGNSNSRGATQKGLPLLASREGVVLPRYAFLGSELGKIFDDKPPVISLNDLVDHQTVYDDAIYLEGRVSDESKIQSLNINGEPILKRKGQDIFFNHLTGLREGENRFSIEASDTFGNTSKKVFIVNRKVPRIRQIGSRMSVSILPLERKGERSIFGDTVYDGLISAFVEQKRFHLTERAQLEEIMKELKLSQTELADPDTASRIGKIVIADAILTGTVYENKNSIEILTRLVDAETSAILESKDVFDEDKSLPNIKRLMQGLALKYKQSYPLLEGMIIKKDGKDILIDLGGGKRVKKDMGMIVFREGEEIRHPETGRALGSEPVEIGEAKIENVYEEFSRASIKKGGTEKVNVKDRVITK
ncbi:MAG: hypothetical protein HY758_04390 [Nitrospirae bacterium]|nr:hypothetical protein [Nitrospirota bacterium]